MTQKNEHRAFLKVQLFNAVVNVNEFEKNEVPFPLFFLCYFILSFFETELPESLALLELPL